MEGIFIPLPFNHFNINSVPKKFHEFNLECNNCSFDFIGLCETKLTSDIDHLYELNNYNRYNNNRTRNSGGIALYVRNKFNNQTVFNDFTRSSDYLKSLFVQIKVDNCKIICGVVYHRPGSSHDQFIH